MLGQMHIKLGTASTMLSSSSGRVAFVVVWVAFVVAEGRLSLSLGTLRGLWRVAFLVVVEREGMGEREREKEK